MALPAKPLHAVPGQAPGQPQKRQLRKGELLFAEGENSRAMYLIKSGMIRIFKKKGDSDIEVDTIHSGQIVGELAFLDGNPRSASGEALTECELTEISGPAFQEVLNKMPDWLKILLKTVVTRLRTASTRIRQLEQASTAFDYSDKDSKRGYVYLSPIDTLKIASGILLVTARNGSSTPNGIELRVGLVQRYVNQIMGVPVAKITTMLDVLTQSGIASTVSEENSTKYYIKDIDFLEQTITYMNEENLVETSKRHDISLRGFVIMSAMAKHISRYPKDATTGLIKLNLAEVKNLETQAAGGKETFRMEEFPELVKLGYASAINIKSQDEAYTTVQPEPFLTAYRLQRIVLAIRAVNEQKRKGSPSPR